MRFVWGMIWVAIGVALIRYNYQIVRTFGKVGWAEQYLSGGFGGTYTMYKIVGVFIVIFALLYAFNLVGWIVSPLGSVFGNPQ